MSSRGARVAGTDGNDFKHRQRVAAQYQTSAAYKFYLKALFGLHFTVLIAMWAKVYGEVVVAQLEIENDFWRRLDLPSAYPWEYVWTLTFIPMVLALLALPRNKSKLMRIAYYLNFVFGILPCSLGVGSQFPELITYIQDPSRNDIPTVRGTFPMVVIWFIFFLIAFQLHIFAMYFEFYLLSAWDPVAVAKDDSDKKTD